MRFRRPRQPAQPIQGAQYGSGNHQENYFGPVTQYVFSGKFERLQDACFDPAPLARDLDLTWFTGREWLIGQIDAFIRDRPRGYVVIQGEAGVGKSTLAAHLVLTRDWLFHFTRLPGGRSPDAARKSLAAQLIARWDLTEELAPGGVLPVSEVGPAWFSRLLEAAARKRDQRQPDSQHREAIVLVVDGLDEVEPESAGGHGLPLGLPDSLPDGMYVLVTSRFGIDQALHKIRNPADWLHIDVDSTDNLHDMRRFIDAVTAPDSGDAKLLTRLRGGGVDIARFRADVARACAGVWVYLRYVLDEIRDGTRDPRSVVDLPADLAGFYAEQIARWRGDAPDEAAQRRWEQVRLPLLGVLGAARAPLTVDEIAAFAAVTTPQQARAFIEETARAFLSCRSDDPRGAPSYALRHQSLRDLLTGDVPERPDLQSTARVLAAEVRKAHRDITRALTPPGEIGERTWDTAGPYARRHLAAHAAACGELDQLASDPRFLVAADPGTVLAQRTNLRTPDGRRSLAAFDLSLSDWDEDAPAANLHYLCANAVRVHAAGLSAACAIAGSDWPVRWAAWAGQGHRELPTSAGAVAIGQAENRDIIVTGAPDGTVRIWDAITGEPMSASIADRAGRASTGGRDTEVSALAVGRADSRDIIVSGSQDGTVRIWDPATGAPIGTPLSAHRTRVLAVAIGRSGDRDIIVSGSQDGTVRITDAATGELSEDFTLPIGDRNWIVEMAIGLAGGRNVVVSADGSGPEMVRIWDAVSGDPVGAPLATHHSFFAAAVAVGRAGDRDIIVAGAGGHTARIWDPAIGAPVGAALDGERSWVNAVTVGRAEGRDIIVGGTHDGTVRIWDAITGEPIGVPLLGHRGPVVAVAIGRAGERDIIVSAAADLTVRIWNAAASELASVPSAGHDDAVTAVAIGRSGDRDIIASGSGDHTVQIWDAATGGPIGLALAGHDGPVRAVAAGRAGGRDVVVSGGTDGTIRIWDPATGDLVRAPLAGEHDSVAAVAIGRAAGRDIIASGSSYGDGTVRIWDAVTGDPIGDPLNGHSGTVLGVAIGRAGDRDIIVSGSVDGTVRTWDADTGCPLLAWDVLTGNPLRAFTSGKTRLVHPVDAIAIGRARDRDIIVTISNGVTLRIWDAVTGGLIMTVATVQRGTIGPLALGQARDCDIIVTGSGHGSLQIWDAVTGEPVGAPLAGHHLPILAVAVGRAGDHDIIVSGSEDHAILLRQHRPRPSALPVDRTGSAHV